MRLLTSTLLAAAIATGGVAPAFADPPRHHHDRDYRDSRDFRGPDRRYDHDERQAYRDGRHDGRQIDRYHWRRGDHFDHRHTSYVVIRDRDYRYYRLPPPRRGEYYARTDRGDILLIAAATGLILWALTD